MRRQDREVLQPEQIDAIIESCDCLRLGAERRRRRVYCAFELCLRAGKPRNSISTAQKREEGRHGSGRDEGGLRSSTARTGSAKRKPAAGIPFSIRALLERERSVRWKRWRKRSGHFLPLWHTIVRTAHFLLPTSRRTLSRSSA